MKSFIYDLLKKYRETMAYLFFGFLTVIVNTVLFFCLDIYLDEIIANTMAFLLSVLFAYWTNTVFVFRHKLTWKTFKQFFLMRIGTIIIDNGGLWLLLQLDMNKILSKTIVNIIIIVINYIFSKFFIYKKKEIQDERYNISRW